MPRPTRRSDPGKKPYCSAVVAAAGASQRMGGEDKLFAELAGVPVLARALLALQNSDLIDEIVVVARADSLERVSALCGEHGISKATKVMAGGATRLISVLTGALAVSDKASLLAIHDGARPCVGRDVIEKAVDAAASCHAAAPGIPVTSTVKKVEGGIVRYTANREGLYEVQTPQVFDVDLIKAALTNSMNNGFDVSDDCLAAELIGAPVCITEGSPENIKITTIADLRLAEAILLGRGVSSSNPAPLNAAAT